MKLFPERSVQEYVTTLGDSLLPQGNRGTSKALEFRFFVVEDSSINAASLPDGTLLINTALLGAIQNESQLAFVLSHEIAHVLQTHYWREVHETRGQRVGLTIAGLVAGAFIGDLGTFMANTVTIHAKRRSSARWSSNATEIARLASFGRITIRACCAGAF